MLSLSTLGIVIGVPTIYCISMHYINKCIEKSSGFQGKSNEYDMSKLFEKFLKKVKDYNKANIWVWMPLVNNSSECGWKTVHIKGNEDRLRKFFNTRNIDFLLPNINKNDVDVSMMQDNDYRFNYYPTINCFTVDYTGKLGE